MTIALSERERHLRRQAQRACAGNWAWTRHPDCRAIAPWLAPRRLASC